MASPMRHQVDFSPEGIARLCSDLSVPARLAVLNKLDLFWNETKPFEVAVEIPIKEHLHPHLLTIAVNPLFKEVTIERRTGNERFASCPDCRVASC